MSLFSMSFSQARVRLVQAGAAGLAAVVMAGCGAGYRPVVTPINPSGPASQPSAFAAVVSSPSATADGIATIIDYSGDTIVAQATIGPSPTSFTVDESGTSAYTVNSDGTLTNFAVSSTLQTKNVTFSTLPSTSLPMNLFSPSAGLWIPDLFGNVADVLTGTPQTFKLAIPVSAAPVSIVGPATVGQRDFAITQGAVASGVTCNQTPTAGPLGAVNGLEVASYTVSSTIPVGKCPVYAVESSDAKRLFVMNRGDDTITVINAQNNTLDSGCPPPTGCTNQSGQTYYTHPTLPLSTTAVTATGVTPPNGTTGMGTVAGPVYAEYNIATGQLVVADYDGGTVSIIDVSLDEYGNDSATFGTTYTVAVGNNPASVTALYDGSRAYTANQTDGTVSIVNLSSHAVEKTLAVVGYPRTVVSVANSLYGKVYVASPNSPYLTIIRTDQDIVDTTVLVEGNIVDVRTSNQNGVSTNYNNVSRNPGYGQPCNLPPAVMTSTYGATYTLANCRTMP